MLIVDTVKFYRFSDYSLMIHRPSCMLNIYSICSNDYTCKTTYDSSTLYSLITIKTERSFRSKGFPNKYEFSHTVEIKRKK